MGLNLNKAVAGMPVGDAFEKLELPEKIAVVALLYRRLLSELSVQQRDADSYERPLLYRGIYWLGVGRVGEAIQYATLACRDERDRLPVPSTDIVPADEGRPLADLLSYAERGERPDWKYPKDEVTYGVLVRAVTSREVLLEQATLLTRADADRIVLISVAPHDVRERLDWSDIRMAFDSVSRELEVRVVPEGDLEMIQDTIDVLKPPALN